MKKLKNYFIYIFCVTLNSSIPFLLIPVITNEFTKYENGLLSYFNIFTNIGGSVLSLGLTNYYSYIYFRKSNYQKKSFLFTSLVITFILCCFSAIIFWISFKGGYNFFGLPYYYVFLIPINVFFALIYFNGQSILRNDEKAWTFTMFTIGLTILNAGLTLFLIYNSTLAWESRSFGIIISNITVATIMLIYLLMNDKLMISFNFPLLWKGLVYSLPFIPSVFATQTLDMGDKLLLGHLLDESVLGGYDVAYKFGSIVFLLGTAINLAFSPYIFKTFSSWDKGDLSVKKEQMIAKIYLIYFVLFIGGLLGLLVSKILFSIGYVGNDFLYSFKFIPILTIGIIFYSFYAIQTIILSQSKKTKFLMYIVIGASLLNLGLNYYFIPLFGDMVAAYTTFLCYFLMFCIITFITGKHLKLPWFGKGIKPEIILVFRNVITNLRVIIKF